MLLDPMLEVDATAKLLIWEIEMRRTVPWVLVASEGDTNRSAPVQLVGELG